MNAAAIWSCIKWLFIAAVANMLILPCVMLLGQLIGYYDIVTVVGMLISAPIAMVLVYTQNAISGWASLVINLPFNFFYTLYLVCAIYQRCL